MKGNPLYMFLLTLIFFIDFITIQSFSAIRSFALLARLLMAISSGAGTIGFFVITLSGETGFPNSSFRITPSLVPDLIQYLTALSYPD